MNACERPVQVHASTSFTFFLSNNDVCIDLQVHASLLIPIAVKLVGKRGP